MLVIVKTPWDFLQLVLDVLGNYIRLAPQLLSRFIQDGFVERRVIWVLLYALFPLFLHQFHETAPFQVFGYKLWVVLEFFHFCQSFQIFIFESGLVFLIYRGLRIVPLLKAVCPWGYFQKHCHVVKKVMNVNLIHVDLLVLLNVAFSLN